MKHASGLAVLVLCGHSAFAVAQDLTWRADIQPMITQKCAACHGAGSPSYEEWNLDRKSFEAKSLGPRMDNYSDLMRHVVWPATGSLARRLDDGKSTGGKPGNHYAALGATEAERAKNLALVKRWLGDGAWNLNRWEARDNVPAVTKEQLSKIKAKY
ncbi:MAG: cytochrome C [Rubrivivax sp.]|nr:cytochrome C [Rubrivivax sp.]MDP3225137.1 cytochrome C [Rubrivivax sp.]MDP3611379.1 cytochrome C [Rubrivivax sp.]